MSKQQKPAGPQTTQERRLLGLSAFDRHQQLMKDAIRYYRAQLPPEQQTVKTDFDVLKEQYRCALVLMPLAQCSSRCVLEHHDLHTQVGMPYCACQQPMPVLEHGCHASCEKAEEKLRAY